MEDETLDLFDPKRLARAADPETSKEAARIKAKNLSGDHSSILYLVRQHPGSTATELAAIRGEPTNHRVSRRLPELESLGRVRRGNARACRFTKRNALTWYPRDPRE